MEKIFVLGVGAQKSGTSWLHAYLDSYSCANFGVLKEYHVWDAKYSPLCGEFCVSPNVLSEAAKDGLNFDNNQVLRYAMQQFNGTYEGYFHALLDDNTRITGDITPSYACLNEQSLNLIRSKFSALGIKVKVVFLMRDPFERCWSAVRMYKKHIPPPAPSDEELLKSTYDSQQFQFRTDYPTTIAALENVFDTEDIYYGLYENLFTPPEIKRLSDFFSLEPNYSLSSTHINKSPKLQSCDPILADHIIAFYSEVYAYCYKRFPETQRLWHKG